ncbi:28S ribosomal protein S22, mitochondrial [Copidosoma floridanum]|uniref:28S ribosomal protein S22, mitochondrial n=1 Tax=Copidosoma floridanum TaxID=29053 RepID=UPI0006C95988|nr:28S ribosomal protein S22, mitochondrial [Copidosoma floridanum]
MLLRGLYLSFRLSSRSSAVQITKKSTYSTSTEVVYDRDPAPYFFSEDIQKILQTLTRPDPEKVFRRRLDGQPLVPPEYKFMTNEALEEARAKAEKFMWERLQIPPIVKLREEDDRILSKDPELQGLSDCKYVFTDITFGVSNRNRVIVVREPNGILRPAKHVERDRLNQIYFPVQDKDVRMPKMFEDEHLQPILDREDYEFILNRACLQFDPDDPNYHRVTKVTYDHVNEKMHHDRLRSTRHYGAMIFYLAWTKNTDNVVLENILSEKIEDAALVIKLRYKLNPSDKAMDEKDPIKLIQHYIETEASSKRKLDQALKTHLELISEKLKLKENVDKAHGKISSSNEDMKT